MHPQKLVEHLTKIYSHDKIFNNDENVSLVSSYYHTYDKMGFPIGMHSHTFYEINIITAGNGYHYIEQQNIEVSVGDVFVLPLSVQHGYFANDSSFEIFHILLHNAFIERYKNELYSLPGFSILFEGEPLIRAMSQEKLLLSLSPEQLSKIKIDLDELVSYDTSNYAGREIQKVIKTLYIISCFSELIHSSHNQTLDKPKWKVDSISIVHSMEYMQNNYHEKTTVSELAKIAHMSRSTYLRQFEKLCKCTPQQYLTKIRIDKANKMLLETTLSITEISQNCGYYDSSHFSHAFYTIKGMRPSDVRKHLDNQS